MANAISKTTVLFTQKQDLICYLTITYLWLKGGVEQGMVFIGRITTLIQVKWLFFIAINRLLALFSDEIQTTGEQWY